MDDVHPLVATPTVLADGNRLPSEVGEMRPTGELGVRSLDTLMAIAEALFATEDGPPPAERLAFLRRELADFMARTSPRGRFYFSAGATVVSIVAPLMVGRLPPFRRLRLDRRIAALTRFEGSALGSVLIALRAILCLIYYEHPDALREIGMEIRPVTPPASGGAQ